MTEMKLDSKYYRAILSGKKPYEIRLLDEKRKLLQVGGVITFRDSNNKENSFQVKILELKTFQNFEEAISSVGIENVLPGVKSLEDGVKIYHKIANYKEKAEVLCVLRIKIEVI